MAHDFTRFPELSNSQVQLYYFESPHKQIFEDFDARVEKVIDGDTIKVSCDFRSFDFPVRFLDINAKELSQGGQEAKTFLQNIIENEEVRILINPKKRVGKYGRLLGHVMHRGININEEMLRNGMAIEFGNTEGMILNPIKEVLKDGS